MCQILYTYSYMICAHRIVTNLNICPSCYKQYKYFGPRQPQLVPALVELPEISPHAYHTPGSVTQLNSFLVKAINSHASLLHLIVSV